MSLNLLDSFGAKGVNYGLYKKPADVIDTEYLSRYFVISEFNPTFTAGKNSLLINGSAYLKNNSEILIECLDSIGNPLFIEMAKYSDAVVRSYAYKESTSFVFSIHVYNDTSDGIGKLILYGTLIDGKSVKWMQNITINKTLKNDSRVRFYRNPSLEVDSAVVPVLGANNSVGLIENKTFSGIVEGLSIIPKKDTNLATVNRGVVDIDYRLTLIDPIVTNITPDIDAFNSQLIGTTIELNINRIQLPLSNTEIDISDTASYVISDVINNKTLKISTPYYYKDGHGNDTVTNIVSANFSIRYPFVNYNNSSSYLTTVIGGTVYTIKQSYADITYKDIRTFSGYVARHKVYRKSLLSNADFSVVADEPITVNEVLSDKLTQNKFYNLLGKFYNDTHISRYWFTSSNNLSLVHSPHISPNSMLISSPTPNNLSGNDYIIVKNDSSDVNRNSSYIPFDETEMLFESGSSYDSNFISLKANVQYIIEISAIILKDESEVRSNLSFYLTGSFPELKKEKSYTEKFGIKLSTIKADKNVSRTNVEKNITFFTPQNDLYGTLVIVPNFCQAYIKNISFRMYGDDGFSPDLFTTRIPWSISSPDESFEIKAELFDINNNLIYSNLKTFKNFDDSGSTLISYLPGGGDNRFGDLFVSGTLYVSESIFVNVGEIYIPNITPRPGDPFISQSRMISVRSDGALVFNPVVDLTADDKYLYLSTGDASNRLLTTITTKKSLSSEYDGLTGRKIYWSGGIKQVEMNP